MGSSGVGDEFSYSVQSIDVLNIENIMLRMLKTCTELLKALLNIGSKVKDLNIKKQIYFHLFRRSKEILILDVN